jgi:hypothetical protein
MSAASMQTIERRIVRSTIDDLFLAGYSVSVFDGEAFTLEQSTDRAAILAAMNTTGEDFLYAVDANGVRVGWVRFVYGNDGWDVMNDNTTNLESAIAKTNALIDKLGGAQ